MHLRIFFTDLPIGSIVSSPKGDPFLPYPTLFHKNEQTYKRVCICMSVLNALLPLRDSLPGIR